MSLAQNALQRPRIDEALPSRHLHAVERPARRRRPRMAYALVALAGAALIGGAQIALTIATTQDSFEVAKLSQQNKQLTWQAQAAAQDLDGISSPQALAAAASKLGLVVGGSASYLRLSDGSVIGAQGSAPWTSTVNPSGTNGVPNALIRDTPPATTTHAGGAGVEPKSQEQAPVQNQPVAPPTAEGLPTPTIR
ncbi:hypothetical protein [Microbacterium azadirachtae]|uniref:hypothetical protein n=1 Tax=Microbacterium azadirachtae TaxID=582680 RepID=UPI000881F246|nr:hypothetical protein [Microbacterium azadirachtae]SDL14849.1 hypothetical protein SAMN04488593_0108 [Microbacterium azadirachtae]SEF44533.1 hypothetical protein SAMN04488592_0107 [Microbacterium azadirachtae]SEF44534.1 hypothetical protein SAMN04488594_0098 [Microbacterium azadirachtae]